MSNVNIMRAVDNIRSGTSVYTPLVEVVVNAIQAIEEGGAEGLVEVTIFRSTQRDLAEQYSEVIGFAVSDDGVGFTDANRVAFDTLYTTHKLEEGGKGFGRFTYLKYFRDVRVQSTFASNGEYFSRAFTMGKQTELIVDEIVGKTSSTSTGTTVRLIDLRRTFPDRSTAAIARSLVEKLLPYFISEDRVCPKVVLQEEDGSNQIILNSYLDSANPLIVELQVRQNAFSLPTREGSENFIARVYKLYSSKLRGSRISLVAHRREVTSAALHTYVPEFVEEFCDQILIEGKPNLRNFVIAVYVTGEYLDRHVSVERGGFEFQADADLIHGIAQTEVEAAAAELATGAVEGEIRGRQERKVERIREYVRDQAPWHAQVFREADVSAIPYRATDEQIDGYLHGLKHAREVRTRQKVKRLLGAEESEAVVDVAAEIVREISESSQSELVHYVALRKSVLDIFKRTLEVDEQGSYRSENAVHDVIFPRKGDTDLTAFEGHNLWIVDERLNFTEYLSSDKPLSDLGRDRPDLMGFGRRIGFRGANEQSNPVTIFEFKKPGRDDFVNASSKEDPVDQIIRYVRQIRGGKYSNPKGREILIANNTPFYGYVVCDLTSKVRTWVEEEKDFKPMPDRMGFFKWHGNLNLYLEVLGWEKVLKDATERNKVFFYKLGIA